MPHGNHQNTTSQHYHQYILLNMFVLTIFTTPDAFHILTILTGSADGSVSVYSFKANKVNSATPPNISRDLFVAYGVSEELSSNGDSQFMSKSFQDFLNLWGVRHRLSSVAFPQSNSRAEIAVKAAKQIIHNNISPDNSFDNDKAAWGYFSIRIHHCPTST